MRDPGCLCPEDESAPRDPLCPVHNRHTRDPRDPDPTKVGIFRDHRCWKCDDGARPCVAGVPTRCEYPRARND